MLFHQFASLTYFSSLLCSHVAAVPGNESHTSRRFFFVFFFEVSSGHQAFHALGLMSSLTTVMYCRNCCLNVWQLLLTFPVNFKLSGGFKLSMSLLITDDIQVSLLVPCFIPYFVTRTRAQTRLCC